MARNVQGVHRSSREEKFRRRRAEGRRRSTVRTAAWVFGLSALLGLVLFVSVNRATNRPGEAVADLGNAHLAEGTRSPVTYNSTPPTSGPHYESIARWGVHTEPIPDELQVHNLEDGGVGVWYNCPEGCPDLVAQLESIVKHYDEQVLLAPYPGMSSRIALTAWTRIDRLDEFDAARIERFIKAFRGIDHHVDG